MSLSFNKLKIERLIQQVFPKSKVIAYTKFKTGLMSQTYKISIKNPHKNLVVKLSKLKRRDFILTNNKILEYLHEKRFPCPKIYLTEIRDRKIITIMDYLGGKTASDIFEKLSDINKRTFLENAGKLMKRIHRIKSLPFWKNSKYNLNNREEWISWKKTEVYGCISFFKYKLRRQIPEISKRLGEFLSLLEKSNFNLSSLHWDYHSSNMTIDDSGKIKGIFDFDNALRGHNLADIGQTAYWLRFQLKSREYFRYFLKGYGSLSKQDLKLIEDYELIFLLIKTKSIWFKKKRLGWITEIHKKMIRELLR
jgi:aminoglycoside phosphotransferase (APT) family kinase protein